MTIALNGTGYAPGRERSWHLSLWLSPELTGWCVHDLGDGRCVALHTAEGNALPDTAELPLRPASVSFVVMPEISTLVPETALAPGTETDHLRMVHGHLPTGLLRDEPITALDARCIYLHDEAAEHALLTRYPQARSLPLSAVLVPFALARAGHGTVLLLHRDAKRVDITVARDRQLLLHNTFHAVNAEDMLYWTLLAIERCGATPEGTRVLTAGPRMDEPCTALLQRYLPDVAPALRSSDVEAGLPGLADAHRFTALIHQFACAS